MNYIRSYLGGSQVGEVMVNRDRAYARLAANVLHFAFLAIPTPLPADTPPQPGPEPTT